MSGKLDYLEVYMKENFRKLWNEVKKIPQGQGELFNEVYWHVKAMLKSRHELTGQEVDELSSIAAYAAIHAGNIRAIARSLGKRGGGSLNRISGMLQRLRGLLE